MKIEDLKSGDVITNKEPLQVLVYSIFQGITQKNAPFVNIQLKDKTGQIDWVLWDSTKEDLDIIDGDILSVTGVMGVYNNVLQLKDAKFQKIQDDSFKYLPGLTEERRQLLSKQINFFIDLTTTPYNELLTEIFHNENFMKKFLFCPAAVRIHDDQIGGLLEHTVAVTTATVNLVQHADINKSLLIAAALLHDIGKVQTYDFQPTIKVTTKGALLGHIILGLQFIPKVINKLRKQNELDFPEEDENYLLHCIASHHGKLEWGSPVEPQIVEAILLHSADKLVSEEATYRKEIQKVTSGNSEYSQIMKKFIFRKQTLLDEF